MASSRDGFRTALVDLQALLFGYTVAFTGPTLASMIADTGICSDDGIVCGHGALVASAASLAALPGALIAGPAADSFGRRHVLIANVVPWLLGCVVKSPHSKPCACATEAKEGRPTGLVATYTRAPKPLLDPGPVGCCSVSRSFPASFGSAIVYDIVVRPASSNSLILADDRNPSGWNLDAIRLPR